MNSKKLSKILKFVIFLLKILSSETSRLCPNYCKCDLYEGRNRADCSGQRLINPYVDLFPTVEVLDLSYNDIAIIDDNCLGNYRFLINLTITHNDVHTIQLDAFIKLRRLSAVDLAYNHLEDIDERLFEANHHLQLLNLEGNKFLTLPSRPFLRSISLRSLNLRNAGINAIDNVVFTALPQLMELDLSQNLLITLNVAAFNAVKHLKLLQLDENPWICDAAMVKFLSILRHRGVVVSLAECNAAYREWQSQLPLRIDNNSNSNKFERMQALENVTDLNNVVEGQDNDEHEQRDDDKSLEQNTTLNWRDLNTEIEHENRHEAYDNDGTVDGADEDANAAAAADDDDGDADDGDDDDDIIDFASYIDGKHVPKSRLSLLGIKVDEKLCEGTRENLCRRYRNCLQQVSHVLIKQMDELSKQNIAKYTQTEMYLAFIFGNVSGITGIVFLFTCVLLIKGLCSKRKTTKPTNDVEDIYETLPYANNAAAASVQLPAPQPPVFPMRRTRRPCRQPVRVPVEHAIIHRGYENDSSSFISRLLGRPARHQYYRATATLIRSLSRTSLFNGGNNGQRDRHNAPNTPTQSEQPMEHSETLPLNQARPETPPPLYVDVINTK